MARARSWAAIYVQDFDAPCVLQFAWISALCCALHRSTSLVIHRSGSYKNDILRFVSFLRSLDRVKRKIEREVKKMFRLTRVLDWFCLDEREKKRARSAIGRKRFKSPSLEAPDTRSLVVHRLSCSELSFLKRCQLSRSRSPEKKNSPANKLVESAHHLRLTETWEFLAQSSETESFRPATGLSDCVVVRKIESNHHSLRRGTVKVVRRSPATRLFRTPIFLVFDLFVFFCVSFESQTLRTK